MNLPVLALTRRAVHVVTCKRLCGSLWGGQGRAPVPGLPPHQMASNFRVYYASCRLRIEVDLFHTRVLVRKVAADKVQAKLHYFSRGLHV